MKFTRDDELNVIVDYSNDEVVLTTPDRQSFLMEDIEGVIEIFRLDKDGLHDDRSITYFHGWEMHSWEVIEKARRMALRAVA